MTLELAAKIKVTIPNIPTNSDATKERIKLNTAMNIKRIPIIVRVDLRELKQAKIKAIMAKTITASANMEKTVKKSESPMTINLQFIIVYYLRTNIIVSEALTVKIRQFRISQLFILFPAKNRWYEKAEYQEILFGI